MLASPAGTSLHIVEERFLQFVCEWDKFFKNKLNFKGRTVFADFAAALHGNSACLPQLTAGMTILTALANLEENAVATQCAALPLQNFQRCLALPGFFAEVSSDTMKNYATLPAAMMLLGIAAPGLQAAAILREAAAAAMIYEDFTSRMNRASQALAADTPDHTEEINVHDGIKGTVDPYWKHLSGLSKALETVDSFRQDAGLKGFLEGKETGGINFEEGTWELTSCGWSEVVPVVDGMRKVLAEFRSKLQVLRSLVSACWEFDTQVVVPIQNLHDEISKKGLDINACGPAFTEQAARCSEVSNIFAKAHSELRRIRDVFPELYTDEEVAWYPQMRHRLNSVAAFVAALQVIQAGSGSDQTQLQIAIESAIVVQNVVAAKKLTLAAPLIDAIRTIAERKAHPDT